MSASVDTMVTVWKYPFHFPCFLLRVHECCIHASPLSLDNQVSLRKYGRIHTGPSPLCKMSAQGQPAALIQAHRHYTTKQYEDSRSHSAIYRGGQFNRWRKPEDSEKTTDLSQVTDNRDHIMLYTSPWSRFELTTSVAIGTDCIGSCKSNYHTITTYIQI